MAHTHTCTSSTTTRRVERLPHRSRTNIFQQTFFFFRQWSHLFLLFSAFPDSHRFLRVFESDRDSIIRHLKTLQILLTSIRATHLPIATWNRHARWVTSENQIVWSVFVTCACYRIACALKTPRKLTQLNSHSQKNSQRVKTRAPLSLSIITFSLSLVRSILLNFMYFPLTYAHTHLLEFEEDYCVEEVTLSCLSEVCLSTFFFLSSLHEVYNGSSAVKEWTK